MLDNVVWTPLAWLRALRVNAPHVGIDIMNDPAMLHMPKANISCVASTIPPLAKAQYNKKLDLRSIDAYNAEKHYNQIIIYDNTKYDMILNYKYLT